MKKTLIAIMALAFLAGCGTQNFLTVKRPDEQARFTFAKGPDGIVMVERATGEVRPLTKNEVKRLNKLQPAAAKVYAERLFDN